MLNFYPQDIEIVSRRIYYDHTEGVPTRTVVEKITFRNLSEKALTEIGLEVENFKANLTVKDYTGHELEYLPNYNIANRKDIPEEILKGLHDEDIKKRKYLLLIQLNVEVNKNEYHSICLNYLEYTKEKKAGKEHEHST